MSKICTDLEQSHKLVELGLDPTTADMHTELIDVNGDMVSQLIEGHGDENKRNFGTLQWSLSALLDLMPKIKASAPILVKAFDNIGDLVPPVAVFWYRRFTLSDFSYRLSGTAPESVL